MAKKSQRPFCSHVGKGKKVNAIEKIRKAKAQGSKKLDLRHLIEINLPSSTPSELIIQDFYGNIILT